MKNKRTILGLILSVLLVSCTDPLPSSEVPSSSSSSEGTSQVEREDVWQPTIVFTPMAYQNDHAYWSSIDFSLRGNALRDALNAKMRSTFKGVTYTVAGDAVQEMDEDPRDSGKVLSVYDLWSNPKGGYSIWNREHTFPQSKLKDGNESLGAKPQVVNISSDVANIFAADVKLNEKRSNNSYGEWNYDEDPDFYYDNNFLTRNVHGKLTDSVLRRGYFSPTPKVRGEIARAQMYMLVMYPDNCSLSENFNIADMIKWEQVHGPTVERDGQRQAGIEKYQKNRNPFIDVENLACYIWGDVNVQTRKLCDGIY